MKRMACVLALAAGAGFVGITALPSQAAPTPTTIASGLQVNIVPLETVSDSATIPMDVKFKGGIIKRVELYIDGVRVAKRSLSSTDSHGMLHFSLEPGILSEGGHEILVKACETDGTWATTSTHLTVIAGDTKAFARFVFPKRNEEVQGIVPIKVKVDDSLGEPYVSFVIDKEFLVMRNYAPYVYNLDSSKYSNGAHVIEVEVISADASRSLQKLTIPINIKNVGGFTNIQPSLVAPKKAHVKGTAGELASFAESFSPKDSAGIDETSTGVVHSVSDLNRSSSARTMQPELLSPAANLLHQLGAPVNPLPGFEANPGKVGTAFASPSVTPPAFRESPRISAPGVNSLAGLMSEPKDIVALTRPEANIARSTELYGRTGNIALRPGVERRARGGASLPLAAPARKAKPAPLLAPAGMKTFQVSFENAFINFDVAPRVENGLPLAPFRAIFEKSGGDIVWRNDTKTLKASNMDHEIEIKIGSSTATVNHLPLTLEATPYLDHGRTIVPLSFFRDAMDFKVNFDPTSGHLLIERK